MNTKLLINGKFVAGAGSKEDVLDPASGAKLATVGEASEGQIDTAVKSAQQGVPRMVRDRAEGSRGAAAESWRTASKPKRRSSRRSNRRTAASPTTPC